MCIYVIEPAFQGVKMQWKGLRTTGGVPNGGTGYDGQKDGSCGLFEDEPRERERRDVGRHGDGGDGQRR